MINLVKSEVRKILGKKSILVLWALLLGFGFILIGDFEILETYADIFYKIEGTIPLIGLVMFIAISGNYTKEYESNMVGLINTTKNGKKYITIAKAIAAGISLSLINVSFTLLVGLKGFAFEGFKNLNDPINKLWYFGNSGSEITVLQMYIIVLVSVTLGSFLFAQIGLTLSSAFKSATIPFILGGAIMAIPFLLQGFVSKSILNFVALTPNWVMMSQLMVRYQIPVLYRGLAVLISISLIILLPLVAYKNFTNSKRL
ncbi:ABC transporter permease [Clostridium botulinum]|uniref:ABC transporter permease n=1 Tax=Clostridium botulinum TaxID=1491 RepID=UPI000772EC12|nr:ABC transporter permease [Clostridium botulinum]MBN1077777.1 ABC transporter permease [Clostridium botulinum]NFE73314.1 ABC transporter permease [Clostridium botulinum]NFG27186.1 ABC transporter permease [Clostridium botulinum]NFG60296.1 ABC transporter permease [Clostridium botulinum]NFH80421.1 ABC transporter permease [Clostridium botulinum]